VVYRGYDEAEARHQRLLIWNRQSDRGCEPKHVVFSISSDGETWTVILDLAQMSNDNTVELDYKTTNPVPGRYLKVEVKPTGQVEPGPTSGRLRHINHV